MHLNNVNRRLNVLQVYKFSYMYLLNQRRTKIIVVSSVFRMKLLSCIVVLFLVIRQNPIFDYFRKARMVRNFKVVLSIEHDKFRAYVIRLGLQYNGHCRSCHNIDINFQSIGIYFPFYFNAGIGGIAFEIERIGSTILLSPPLNSSLFLHPNSFHFTVCQTLAFHG